MLDDLGTCQEYPPPEILDLHPIQLGCRCQLLPTKKVGNSWGMWHSLPDGFAAARLTPLGRALRVQTG